MAQALDDLLLQYHAIEKSVADLEREKLRISEEVFVRFGRGPFECENLQYAVTLNGAPVLKPQHCPRV